MCDAGSHDEDCDPTTFGGRDGDSDGYVDDACCNVGPSGLVCGDDCDDTSAGVSPGDGEACDTRDNDCDGVIDDGVPPGVYYRDLDRDGAGDPNARLEAHAAERLRAGQQRLRRHEHGPRPHQRGDVQRPGR
ncbi:MAG: putative metal-binding motif-containing protein [Sandaracinaceae bacterium]|nr:putative metal-binding motif-containing protein [Sandaracinaceae bacterium]